MSPLWATDAAAQTLRQTALASIPEVIVEPSDYVVNKALIVYEHERTSYRWVRDENGKRDHQMPIVNNQQIDASTCSEKPSVERFYNSPSSKELFMACHGCSEGRDVSIAVNHAEVDGIPLSPRTRHPLSKGGPI